MRDGGHGREIALRDEEEPLAPSQSVQISPNGKSYASGMLYIFPHTQCYRYKSTLGSRQACNFVVFCNYSCSEYNLDQKAEQMCKLAVWKFRNSGNEKAKFIQMHRQQWVIRFRLLHSFIGRWFTGLHSISSDEEGWSRPSIRQQRPRMRWADETCRHWRIQLTRIDGVNTSNLHPSKRNRMITCWPSIRTSRRWILVNEAKQLKDLPSLNSGMFWNFWEKVLEPI